MKVDGLAKGIGQAQPPQSAGAGRGSLVRYISLLPHVLAALTLRLPPKACILHDPKRQARQLAAMPAGVMAAQRVGTEVALDFFNTESGQGEDERVSRRRLQVCAPAPESSPPSFIRSRAGSLASSVLGDMVRSSTSQACCCTRASGPCALRSLPVWLRSVGRAGCAGSVAPPQTRQAAILGLCLLDVCLSQEGAQQDTACTGGRASA